MGRSWIRASVGATCFLSLSLIFACGGDDDGDATGAGATGGASGSSGSGAGGGSGGSGGGGDPTEPIVLDPSDFTYTLEQSPNELPLWTTPATHKLRVGDRPPKSTSSGLHLSAARREFEPVQLVVGPASGSVTVSVEPFPDLGGGQRVSLSNVRYQQGWGEFLDPLGPSDTLSLSGDHGTGVWLTVYVPEGAPAGEHTTTLTVTPSGGSAISIPVTLYVFDFSIPEAIHFASQLNINLSGLIPDGGSEQDAKDLLFEHRFTPKSVTWPSGFRWNITWDSDHAPNRCESFYDEPDEGEAYSIRHLARKYILGEGWNGIGFPNAMIFQFVDNSTPRPDTFCGISRGDHEGSSAYNEEWSQFLSSLDTYLVDNGYADKAYYYVQNEPQDDEDHRLAAHLCRLTKAAAPHLRIAVSEEPKPEIAEDPAGACGYDIWIAHIRAYKEEYAWQRQREFGETVWFYSLDHDPDPYFNPTRVDVQGMHQRIIPWTAWVHRITGWAYYDAGRFFDGARPTVRAELLREGFEDYEYLYLANGGAHPNVDETANADPTVKSVTSGMTSWNKDADALMALRHELGKYIEGTRDTLPVLEVESNARPRAAYYLNFQDPEGSPSADPLVVDGNTYMKIGWEAWDDDAGLGWYGENIANSGIALFGYDDVDGYTEAQKSYVYDDYGRNNLFEFAVENGRYDVTIGVGRPSRGYPNDPHTAIVEGIRVVDDEPTTDEAPTIERTETIDLTDGKLSVEVGGKSPSTNNWSYTFLSYIVIEPVD
ncbi:MAG: glycoside hydrolase domain-containing protein [Myxococcota bacterium]